MFSKRTIVKFLAVLLIMLLAAPAAFAQDQVKLIFNGREYPAIIILKDGVSYVSAEAVRKIPGLEIGDEALLPVRKLFESQGGEVTWDGDNWQIIVSWREKAGDYTADELVLEYSERLKDVNSYKLKGSHVIEFEADGIKNLIGMPDMPKMNFSIEGVYQCDPMAMYIKQTMEMPQNPDELELSPEELEALGFGQKIVTEMVWLDNAIYQKGPGQDQWIVQSLEGLEETFDLDKFMQISPQQSLEMMNKAGVINVFGEDVEKDGQQYYTIKNYIDSDSYRKLAEEILKDFDIMAFIGAMGAQSTVDPQEAEEFNAVFEKMLDIILNNINIDYHIDTLVNKETLLPDYMSVDLIMKLDLKQILLAAQALTSEEQTEELPIPPEMDLNIVIKLTGDYQYYDYGTKLELPDLSNAISQEEYIQQLMEQAEEQ